jgi:hypothetical protein
MMRKGPYRPFPNNIDATSASAKRRGLAGRATRRGYRGCGMTNAAVEYPDTAHPARLVAEGNKRELRRRLRQMTEAMGAADPA